MPQPLSVRLDRCIPHLGLTEGEIVAYWPDRPDLGILVTRALPADLLPHLAAEVAVFRRVSPAAPQTPEQAERHLRVV